MPFVQSNGSSYNRQAEQSSSMTDAPPFTIGAYARVRVHAALLYLPLSLSHAQLLLFLYVQMPPSTTSRRTTVAGASSSSSCRQGAYYQPTNRHELSLTCSLSLCSRVYLRSALFLTTEEIQNATRTLASYRNGDIAPGQVSDAELWHARRGTSTLERSPLMRE